MSYIIYGETYEIIDSLEYITMADSFVKTNWEQGMVKRNFM